VLLLAFGLLGALVSMVMRLRRADGVHRQQLRLIAASAALVAAGFATLLTVQALNGGRQTWASGLPLFVSYFCLPILFAVAVLRFRLYDIEVILNRTLVVALGTSFAAVGYTVLVVTVGQGVDTRAGGFWVSVLATALVALAFQPLRRGVVRLADRLAFGPRAEPYDALASFSRTLSQTPSSETLLRAVAEAACRSVAATTATAVLEVAGEASVRVTWPPGAEPRTADPHVVEVSDTHTTLGGLEVVLPPGRPMSDTDRRLLGELADQCAVAFRNLALERGLAARVASLDDAARALAESRRRLVVAEDTARRMLEEELRREVLPRLEPMPARIRALAAEPLSDEGCAAVEHLVTETNAALEALRDVTRGVFPTVLERSGLVAAMASSRGAAPAPTLHVGAGADRRFPPHLETAAYAAYRAAATTTTGPLDVTLEVACGAPDELVLTILGLDPALLDAPACSDRVEAAGGRVRMGATGLAVRLPLPAVPDPVPAVSSGPTVDP
jgi:hypothetical protein